MKIKIEQKLRIILLYRENHRLYFENLMLYKYFYWKKADR